MSRRPSQAASTKTNDAAGGGTTQDAHLAYHSRIEASLQCLKTLLSPSQANSKAWRLIHPQSGTSTGSGTNNPQSTTNPPINASSISSLSSIVGSQNMDHLQSSDSIPSTSRQTLDNATAMLGQPTIVHVHRRTATRASKDLSTSTATIAPGSSNSSNSQQPPLLPPNSSTGADIYRATCYIPVKGEEELSNLEWSDVQDAFRRLVATPECRPAWDRIVEESEIVEEVDADTRISRTVFKLGWPASPRDAITVSRTLMDSKSLIDISCSLPRSPDAPVYLRPAPPYVRSHVNLFAWCLERSAYSGKPHVKLTCFWSWDLRGAWIGMPAGGIGARLPNLITSLVQHVKDGDALHVPFLSHYGRNVELTNRSFNSSRDMVTVEYQVVCDDAQELNQNKEEARDLQLEWSLPAAEGWDVHVDVKPLDNHKHSSVEWKSTATRAIQSGRQSARMTFNVQHLQSEGPTGRSLLAEGIRGRITVQRIAASQDVKLRINDKPFAVEELQLTEQEIISSKIDLDLTTGSSSLADDSASISNMSMRSEVSSASATTMGDDIIKRAATPSSISGTASKRQTLDVMGSPMQASLSSGRPAPDRNTAIASIIRRNYIYFTSLLQEPEAKWKHFSDTRGVTITQLDSIDPTLVVYRAEATFVGVGVWDLFAAIANAGVKNSWDKGAEESRLVEDLGDSSKVWWNKLKGTWPVASRDSVVVETVYKSPSSIHIFSFSSDDKKLFPGIPSPDTGAIRTQIDLRGWSIESLSPTTAHITLIEQSDPKGWTSKSSATPAAMTAAVAGVGDFAIKQGGPPITTRLLGGKIRQMKYEADKSSYRIEYDLAENHSEDLSGNVECEIRCDVETWSPSLDVVVDPPPINVSCLRRHKLSQGGSGLWLTIEQPIASLEDDPSRITVRKANNKEKGVVYVNGARMKVDMDDLKDAEVTQLREQKRTKPKRVPLDLVNESPRRLMIGSASPVGSISRAGTPTSANGVSTASSNLAAITNAGANGNGSTNSVPTEQTTMDVFSDEKPRQPMTCALDVLFLLRRIHAERSPDPAGNPAGWSLVANRNGLYTRRKMMQSISPTVIVQRGDKVVEGLTAEDILSVISNVQCRKVWDERVEATTNLESYGNGASTAFFTTKGSFPFRGRAFSLASLVARSGPRASQFGNPSAPTVYFHASSSYSMSQSTFSAMKLNPSGLPMGKVLIDGWILETLDPYSSTLNYQIPSTRVTHLVAVDYAGSLPITVNAMWNTQLSRSIAHVEEYLKQQGTLPTLRAPPSCMEVLGDGRDEDHDLIWNLSDDKTKRACTLLSNDFNNVTKVYNVLVTLDAASSLVEETSTPLAVPLPRRAALSNASTTRGIANAATMFSSPSSDANLSSPSNAVVEGGTSVDSAPLSRTTSISSLRSVTSRPRPSVIRKETKKPSDLVVLDVEVELRHYERGYDIILKSMLGDEKAKETEDDDDESLPAETPRASAPSEQKEFPSLSSKESTENKENKIGTSDIIWPLEIPSEDADEVLPLSVSTFDLPPSAVLAATLDPSARPKKHLVRVTLPTATFMGTARSNPFNGPELDEAPAWYDKVRERGALISLELKPRGGEVTNFGSPVSNGSASFDNQKGTSGSSTPSDSGMSDQGETDSQQVPVYYKGVRISVTHVNKTSAMLQRESDNEQEYAILKRIAPPAPPRAEGQPTPAGMSMHKRRETAETKLEERLPVQLQSPLAKSFKFIRDASESAAEKVNAEEQAKKDSNVISPSSSVGDTTIGLTPMANRANQLTPSNSTLANASSSTPTPTTRIANPSTPASAASAQIMSILNSYPLSRLGGGASTAVSTTVANGGLFSRRTDADADVNGSMSGADGEKGKANGDQRGIVGGTDDENATTMPGQLIIATEQIRKRIVDIRFTWSTMILVALIAFLLGSLVRSLLEPADFILVNKLKGTTGLRGEGGQAIEAAAVREIKKLFDQGQGPQIGEPNSPHHSVAWRELKRLIELRNLFGGRWDLVIAAVRR